jgi:hypothetical protein
MACIYYTIGEVYLLTIVATERRRPSATLKGVHPPSKQEAYEYRARIYLTSRNSSLRMSRSVDEQIGARVAQEESSRNTTRCVEAAPPAYPLVYAEGNAGLPEEKVGRNNL